MNNTPQRIIDEAEKFRAKNEKYCESVAAEETMYDAFIAGAMFVLNDWVKVETILPKINIKVLIAETDDFNDYNITTGHYTEHGKWYAPFKTRNNVTHWRYLPTPPKE